MKSNIEMVGDIAVVHLNGRLDAAVSRDLKDEITALLKQHDHGLILDMQAVDFIDSSGLGLLVSVLKNSSEFGCELGLCGLSPQAQSLFELTRMTRIFTIYTDQSAAVAGMS